jgi:hypothetical protein
MTKTFPPALALAANRFTVAFNYVPFTITRNADHFNPLPDSAWRAINKALRPDLILAYTPFLCGSQQKNGHVGERVLPSS